MDKPYSPACDRNCDALLTVLRERFATVRHVLEIGSGTGQHAVHFAAALPWLTWQTSDVAAHLPGISQWLDEARLPNTPAPLLFDVNFDVDRAWPAGPFDAVFSANTLHIMAWPEVVALFSGLNRMLRPGALLTVYGPFNEGGRFSSASNADFDAALRADAAHRGIRDIEAVQVLAQRAGLVTIDDRAMPANNRCISWRLSA